ncbi:unnamed protein product [Rotaria sp. Silwood1]|nr:unnamed protein product [Rotaria sp. Silwood1]CAF1224885.1 unnamed protein product [Rotaria sp. Silwood1]CAF3462652.1 unnamed protein product [Rotaria sp. Silwood1]CAF3477443.1 unnamed protein product [Rotaria sp. Silwood1]CAF3489529.1 unnamed protein product [Rotaria sp. Silwood1]
MFLLDQFPIELLHSIFDYLLTNEILFAFADISDYVDSVLLGYKRYHVNLQSIRKCDFDLICRKIRAHQIIQLTLCDDRDTTNQSQLFIQMFRIEQFIHLRQISLIRIDKESWTVLLEQLSELSDQIPILYFDTTPHINIQIPNLLLPHINRLVTCDSEDFFNKISTYSTLRHLTISNCSPKQFLKIVHQVTELRSFKLDEDHSLTSFRSPFWLEYKCWFVAYDIRQSTIYSVPRFAIHRIEYPMSDFIPDDSTIPRTTLFYDQIKHLTLFWQGSLFDLRPPPVPFAHVETFELGKRIDTSKVSISILESIVNFASIQRLKVSLAEFKWLLPHMPQVHHLTLYGLESFSTDIQTTTVFHQIRSLDLSSTFVNLGVKRLNFLFPSVEKLHMEVQYERDIIGMIDGFQKLSHVKIELAPMIDRQYKNIISKQWLERNTRLSKYKFTCRIEARYTFLWIGEKHEQNVSE